MRSVYVQWGCGCSMPGLAKLADAESSDADLKREQAARVSRGQRPVVETRVKRYTKKREGKLAAAVLDVLAAFRDRVIDEIVAEKLEKFDPNQPRVPAGHPDGGQWTDEGTHVDTLAMTAEDFDSGTVEKEMRAASRLVDLAGLADPSKDPSDITNLENAEANIAAKVHVQEALTAALADDPAYQKLVEGRLKSGFGNADNVAADLTRVLVHSWAETSSNSHPTSMLMQAMANEEFGLREPRIVSDSTGHTMLTGPDSQVDSIARDVANYVFTKRDGGSTVTPAEVKAGFRSFLRAMYNETQADLKRNGIDHVWLARGMTFHLSEGVDEVGVNPISSFTASMAIAHWFGQNLRVDGSVLIAKVPASRILSTPRTGFGCRHEREFAVLGGGAVYAVTVDATRIGGANVWYGPFADKLRGVDMVKDYGLKKSKPINIDARLEDADWTKSTWDLPPYKSPAFMRLVLDLDAFRKLPVYRAAVRAGLIVNDQWARLERVETQTLAKAINDDLIDALMARIRTLLEGLSVSLVELLRPYLERAFRDGSVSGMQAIGFDASRAIVEQVDELAVEWAAKRGGVLIKDLAGTTRKEMRRTLASAVEDGLGPQELAAAIRSLGAFGEVRSRVIARTELAWAHESGNLEGWRLSGEVAGKRWLLADTHPAPDECDEAAELGVIGLEEEFFPGVLAPPAHPQCCLPGTEVSTGGLITGQMARHFAGEVIVLSTERRDLSVTVNHPVLTQRGWVHAGCLQLDDYVLEAVDPSVASSSVDPDAHHMPTLIEKVAHTLAMSGNVVSVSMPTSAEDFHGDGMPDGEVDVVLAAGPLAGNLPAPTESGVDGGLGLGHWWRRLFDRKSLGAEPLDWVPSAAHGSVRAGRHLQPELGGSVGVDHELSFREGPNVEAVLAHVPPDGEAVTAKFLGEVGRRLAGHVEAVQLKGLRKEHFLGHVYNISTSVGWYFANGIITHNCLCSLEPILREENWGQR